MALVDILAEVLSEMMGVPIKKTPPPRKARQPETPLPGGSGQLSRRGASAQAGKAQEPAQKKRRDSMAVAAERHRETVASTARMLADENRLAQSAAPQMDNGVAGGTLGNLSLLAAPKSERAGSGVPPGLVEALKNDQSAVRAALVYSEIFGPPVCDRRDWK